jgi:hypothetical protein
MEGRFVWLEVARAWSTGCAPGPRSSSGREKIVDDCGRLQGLLPMNLAIYIVAGATIVAILIYAFSQGRPPILERATNDKESKGMNEVQR